MPTGEGYFYPVTLLTDVRAGMSACTEETFGPVAVVMVADDAEQALAIANDTPCGLAASVWTSTERGEAMARRIEAGQVAVNGIVKTDPRLPSGGIKRSGYGRELRSEEHTSELQSRGHLVCRLLLEKKKLKLYKLY